MTKPKIAMILAGSAVLCLFLERVHFRANFNL